MTQEKANKIFATSLGEQLNVIYVTSDDRAFVRHEEAVKHANGELDPDTQPLADKTIIEWYPMKSETTAFPDSALIPDDVEYVDIKEFRELGYLQEINRRFLHPLGMALSIRQEEDGTEKLEGIWDCRSDAEGVYYNIADSDEERKERFRKNYAHVEGEMTNRLGNREVLLGFGIEPIPEK
jgi:hypothetical protein